MRIWIIILACLTTAAAARGSVAYSQPANGGGQLLQSSWWDPDDSDWDIYSWDDFMLSSAHPITEVRWRGGYIYGGAYGGPVINFTIEIYPSIAAGSQPDVTHAPLVSYETGGNAGQTYAGVYGGTTMYDYQFTLPAAFQAAANTRYWIYILAWQHGIPEWGLSNATGGNGHYFRYVRGIHMYQSAPGDFAMTLMSSDAPTYTIAASVSPAAAGAVQGAGSYPEGTNAALQANANAGWAFQNWTENNVVVSSNNPYLFTVNSNRTLVANFIAAYVITTQSLPTYGGTTTGDGVFTTGASVTVEAFPNPGFAFTGWSEYGSPVSSTPVYTFSASANRTLAANFETDPLTVAFNFDNAPVHTSLPVDVTVAGLMAHLTATGSGFSIQPANTMGFTPAGFDGLCIYPNSVFPADLLISYSRPLTYFSILYSPQELGCDDSARMRVTAYRAGQQVATATTSAPQPGTWPTGNLELTSATPFDSVTVHYDSRPPTCQDWGPIFLADNMVVTQAAMQLLGDLDCDGLINNFDIDPFVLGLTDPAAYAAAYPACDATNGDVNRDGVLNNFDIDPFVLCILSSGCP
ncbi:MAG: hypothetical protein JNG88_00150 [Phycisphaerales bacterium]|nr:hypothetical protein [Phycisphaerales bacterium]